LEILAVATKSPWPPIDGGRLALHLTLEALGQAGHHVTVVYPVCHRRHVNGSLPAAQVPWFETKSVAVGRRSLPADVIAALRWGLPTLVARHTHRCLRERVAELLEARHFDVVHVEQVQARANIPRSCKLPVVVRSHNVESDIARYCLDGSPLRPLLGNAVTRYAAWEGATIAEAAAAVALTNADADRLQDLARGKGRVTHIAVPFPATLPAATASLPGDPPVVLLAGQGWLPQREDNRWFLVDVWPLVRAVLPGARLHVFGPARGLPDVAGASFQADLPDSQEAFDPRGILVVPMRRSFGVRMKVLEAWARAIPVVATPAAVQGLAASDGVNLLLGSDPASLAAGVVRVHLEGGLGGRLRAGGSSTLRTHHDPAVIAGALVELYTESLENSGGDPQ